MGKIVWEKADDVLEKVNLLKEKSDFYWLQSDKIFCFRSFHSQSRAIARIWGLSRIWQIALELKPAYVIEVIAERYDRLTEREKEAVLLHEIAHIPKNFSGALIPHYKRGKRQFTKLVNSLKLRYYLGNGNDSHSR